MRRICFALLAVLLLGGDCKPSPAPEPESGTDYCHLNEYTISDSIIDGVSGMINSILHGIPSEDRRATVRVEFSGGYCSGVVLSPHTVLTAGHCGYEPGTLHNIKLGGYGSTAYVESDHVAHPDYLLYTQGLKPSGRLSDLLIVHTRDPLPEPYVDMFYTSDAAEYCRGLVAQGWGQWEGSTLSLREARYLVTNETPQFLESILAPDGKICFGDSGGPLYADVGGNMELAGITSVTYSQDCEVGGGHVKVAAFADWIKKNTVP